MNRAADGADAAPSEELSPIKRALVEVRELRRRLAAHDSARSEPIAIVGMACRLPGGIVDAEGFWQMLREGAGAVGQVPPERWDNEALFDPDPDAPGKVYTSAGAFVHDPGGFDPYFFGIPPREARAMDPQQRLLLEVAWEALENAGIDASGLVGSATGVFVGIGANDYATVQARGGDLRAIDAYHASGVSHSVAAGRLSYFFGFQGPSVALDTACSSSLVAIHAACTSLRQRECQLALAGGANLILAPDYTVNFCRARMLSPTGACRTFDAAADGYVRGEGIVLLALKRLSDARANGDRILALLRGSAINQDGRSTGLTVPNGSAQEAVIRQALAQAGIAPQDVQYVEAHGTGTPLGDPIEVQALAAALGPGRRGDSPLLIGSVKTNIGHLEATAGVAGLMKVVLAMRHGEIPAHLHYRRPNPHIDWSTLPVEVTSARRPWRQGRRIAGVSSFGFSGTNAHVIVEAAPQAEVPRTSSVVAESAAPPAGREDAPGDFVAGSDATSVPDAVVQGPLLQVLPLSAKDPQALNELARRYQTLLGGSYLAHSAGSIAARSGAGGVQTDMEWADIAYTAAAGRAHFTHRMAIVADDPRGAADALARCLRQEFAAGVHVAHAPASPQIAFLFTGQGAQHGGMGRELYATEPLVREVLDACAAAVQNELPRPLLQVMFENPEGLLDQTQYTQPALFALEVALARLWRSWGIEPAFVLGHSVGEYAAACIAGVLDMRDGVRLIAARARFMQSLPTGGGMISVQGDESDLVEQLLRAERGRVAVAARNAPGAIVLAGEQESLNRIASRLAREGVLVQPLRVSHAFHSPLMEPILGEFERRAAAVPHHAPEIGWISNVTGEVLEWADWSQHMGRYWRRHVREPVLFEQGVRAAAAQGVSMFLEIGPHPVLSTLARATLGSTPDAVQSVAARNPATTQTSATPRAPMQPSWHSSLMRDRGERRQMLEALAQIYVGGARVDWAAVHAPWPRRRLELPTYPFQRQHYWLEQQHPVTRPPVDTPTPAQTWERALRAGRRQEGYAPLDLAIDTFPAKWAALQRLSLAYIVRSLRALGVGASAGERYDAEELVRTTGILPVYTKLMDRWLMRLAEAGLMARQGAHYIAHDGLTQPDVDSAREAARQQFSAYPAMFDYVELCGSKLTDVLTGRESALETLFPGGSSHITEGLYRTSIVARYFNEIVRSVVQAIAGAASASRTLSLLEIGAGTGGTTSLLLPDLAPGRTRYVYTDVSRLFLVQARKKFAEYDFLHYALLDIERPPREQGFREHAYDVIVAANVLHATRDLAATLRHARSLLASGGVLIMLETTDHPIWLDITTGLIEGWQKFEDAVRGKHPLLDPERWSTLLRECGFAASAALPANDSPMGILGQHVILARAPDVIAVAGAASPRSIVEPLRHDEMPAAATISGALPEEAASPGSASIRERLDGATPEERLNLLEGLVCDEVCAVLGIDRSHRPASAQGLQDFGVDSLMAVELRNRLAQHLELTRKLTATLIFDYPNVQAIARYLAEDMLGFGARPDVDTGQCAQPGTKQGGSGALSKQDIEQMGDAEAEALLMEKLNSL